MSESESIASLAKAHSMFLGEVKDIIKDKKGFNYSYGDLGQVLEISRPLLCKYGLSVIQFPVHEGDKVGIKSTLVHESGEWMSESFCVNVERPPLNKLGKETMTMIQVIGSILTYIRRYATVGILGITQIDDDGSLGETGNGHHPLPGQTPLKKVTDETYAALCSSMMTHGISDKSQEDWKAYFKVKALSELSENNARAIINQIKKRFEAPEGSSIQFPELNGERA